MNKTLDEIVDDVVGSAFKAFVPGDRGAFEKCDSELLEAEDLIISNVERPGARELLAQILSTRIWLAAEMGDAEAVLDKSEGFLKEFSSASLSYFNVLSLRLRSLHALDRHGDELREALEFAKDENIHGDLFIVLLEGIATRHPGSIGENAFLREKIERSLIELRMSGYSLPECAGEDLNLEHLVFAAAADLRLINQKRSMSLLAEYDS